MTVATFPRPAHGPNLDPIGPLAWLGEVLRWVKHAALVWGACRVFPDGLPHWERERRGRIILCRADEPAWQPWRRWRLIVIGHDSALWAFAQQKRVITVIGAE